MNKRLLINLGLLSLIIVLVLISVGLDNEAPEEKTVVSSIDITYIDNINVTRQDKPALQFSKQQDKWFMNEPLKIRVNVARINAMLKLATSESHSEFNVSEVDLAALGLAQPEITLSLNDHLFQFGTTDGIDQRRYVLYQDKIYMVNDFLYAQLDSKPGFFADTLLLPEGTKLKKIEFPNNTFSFNDNVWQMQTLMDIKPDQITKLVYSWENATAISVSSYQTPQMDFPIVLTTQDDKTIRYEIVSTAPYLILGRKDLEIQYHMASDEAQKLLFQENTIDAQQDEAVN